MDGTSSVYGAPGEGDRDRVVERVRDLCVKAKAQACTLAELTRRERRRRRRGIAMGGVVGGAGLVGAVALAGITGTTATLWWLNVPTWIAIATPIMILLQSAEDGTETIAARAAGTAAFAEELRRSVEVAPAAFDTGSTGLAMLEPLSSVVERNVEETTRVVQADRSGADKRRHRRIVPRERRVIVTTADGRRLRALIADVSVSGVAMAEGLPRLEKGERVLIGRRPGTVARIWERGIAFEFETAFHPAGFDENVRL